MTDYSKMSDFEINKRVFKLMMTGRDWDRQGKGLFDYCNNPSDAWPIIVENEICIEFEIDEVEGVRQVWADANIGHPACNGFQYFSDENPLRAAMIVFLMMKDAESKN
ncbi:phage protein NinX family protein [Serratia marcescens]|uniref:phage protein NinX family protein n=1 Tax=Serratia marcescens TaxID=615 RepID=UPI0034E8B9E3